MLLLIPLFGFSDHLHGSEQRTQSSYSLLVLGDSLSAGYGLEQQQGWVSLLQNLWYNEGIQIDVINAAISGETSDGALARLPRLLEQHRPSHVLIELGGNDGLQGHPVTKLKSNLIQIVNLAQAAGAEVFLQDMQIPTNYGRRYTQMFADAYDEVARVQNVPLLPFFLESVALNPELMQNDGIHPNAQAQPQIAEFMRQQLTPLIVE
ncbi:arylesterase [Alteromonas aestuariivivens]|uniref:Arylesterase n=1 Tax=Alteromonas aestuariivivens TaxID=1938339 RepID=A0A3D8M5A1_9ALTE|nr:arylesterase [Alteromonas aestuariivivens]